MKIASLDLGSNSFLCLILESDGSCITHVLADEVRIVRLSEGVLKTGLLGAEALARAEKALADFKTLIDQLKVDRVIAVTTAVARQAKNAQIFIDMVKNFGFPIQIISGDKEAEVSYMGAVSGLSQSENENVLVIDIGGGSTEMIFNRNYAQSFNFGVVSLKEKYSVNYPIPEDLKNNIIKYIDQEISGFLSELVDQELSNVVAVAGTPTTLAAMEIGYYSGDKVDGFMFDIKNLNQWYQKLSSSTPEKIIEQYKIDAGRADVLALGVLILIRILTLIKRPSLMVSIRGVRYGVALQVIVGAI
jgi:exopolyphosphatase/guanosine-5'-triphosphate,3'-diphosphate pyrophosphatase